MNSMRIVRMGAGWRKHATKLELKQFDEITVAQGKLRKIKTGIHNRVNQRMIRSNTKAQVAKLKMYENKYG